MVSELCVAGRGVLMPEGSRRYPLGFCGAIARGQWLRCNPMQLGSSGGYGVDALVPLGILDAGHLATEAADRRRGTHRFHGVSNTRHGQSSVAPAVWSLDPVAERSSCILMRIRFAAAASVSEYQLAAFWKQL